MQGQAVHYHNPLDVLTWPVMTGSIAVWPLWPWFNSLWEHAPTPTALYMVVSAAFMLFQMSDKMGLLDRFKKRKLQEAPDEPEDK